MNNKELVEDILKRGQPKGKAKKEDLQKRPTHNLLGGVVVLPAIEK